MGKKQAMPAFLVGKTIKKDPSKGIFFIMVPKARLACIVGEGLEPYEAGCRRVD